MHAVVEVNKKKMAKLEAFRNLYKPKLEEKIKSLSKVAAWSINQKNKKEETISQLTKEKFEIEKSLIESQEVAEIEFHDLHEQLHCQKVINDELQRGKEKA